MIKVTRQACGISVQPIPLHRTSEVPVIVHIPLHINAGNADHWCATHTYNEYMIIIFISQQVIRSGEQCSVKCYSVQVHVTSTAFLRSEKNVLLFPAGPWHHFQKSPKFAKVRSLPCASFPKGIYVSIQQLHLQRFLNVRTVYLHSDNKIPGIQIKLKNSIPSGAHWHRQSECLVMASIFFLFKSCQHF